MRTATNQRRLLILVGAIVLVETMFFATVTPLLPYYADRFELSRTGAGILSGSYPAGVLVGAVPSGVLASRLGLKRTVLLGLAGLAVTSVAFGLAGALPVLVAARFLQGVAGACSWTGGLAWLVNAAPPDRRGELLGTALGAAIVGALLGPVLGGIASVLGPAPTFLGVALLALGLAAQAWATPPPPASEPQPVGRLLRALGDRRVGVGIWFILLPALGFGVLGVIGPLRLDELGFGTVAIGATFLVAAGAEAVLSPVVGRLSDRRGRLPLLRRALWGAGAATLLVPWVGQRWPLAAALVLTSMALGTFYAPAFSLLTDAADQVGLHHGFGFALMNLAWAPGQAIGSSAGGAVAQATVDAVPFLAVSALCALTLAVTRPST